MKHGTLWAYQTGCRCDECREANTDHGRQYRAKKRGLLGRRYLRENEITWELEAALEKYYAANERLKALDVPPDPESDDPNERARAELRENKIANRIYQENLAERAAARAQVMLVTDDIDPDELILPTKKMNELIAPRARVHLVEMQADELPGKVHRDKYKKTYDQDHGLEAAWENPIAEPERPSDESRS